MPLALIMGCVAGKRSNSVARLSSKGLGRNSASGPMDLSSEEEALFVAISFGKVHRIASLIDKIDDLNIYTVDKMTPLLHTCKITRGELCSHVTRLLLKQPSCDVNAQEYTGKTALMFACMSKENTDVVRILVRNRKCDVNITDTEGYTALMYAVSYDNVEAVRVLVLNSKSVHKLDVNLQSLEGTTAADMAVHIKNKDICQLLVDEAKVDISQVQQPARLKSVLGKT